MRIVVAGGHGQIALLLARRLTARGDIVTGLIGNPDHAMDVVASGATPVLADPEAVDAATLAGHLAGADAVVFAAGAGPGRAGRPPAPPSTGPPPPCSTGRVTLARHVERGAVPREDVAAVLVALLDTPSTAGRTYELVSGDTPVAEAVTRDPGRGPRSPS